MTRMRKVMADGVRAAKALVTANTQSAKNKVSCSELRV
jgi:hypothetical protein